MILSIDVGICNLSYCLLTEIGYIIDWGIIDLCGKENSKKIDLITVGRNLRFAMRDKFLDRLDIIKTVIIENQLGLHAVRMRCVQHMIMQYWLGMGVSNVQFISPKLKLKNYPECDTSTYAQRKQSSIMITDHEIQNEEICCNKFRDLFRNCKKKDDLSDCYLQAKYFLSNKY